MQSEGMQLILKCNLASRHFSVQNKAAINPPEEFLESTGLSGCEPLKADIAEPQKAAIPHKDNNYYIYLLLQFEKFWSLYPEKNPNKRPKQLLSN
ncbi:Legionella vir region protein [Legionella gratiana]|uniref:Legionella vir region protein n=1 Tax=Legionella gratiana TaxID=45066 RepID=A0A378JDY1_9GAMM|nr:Legionella vir region protein [Legionella gratiana]STX45087.1 Legionella vir region protein [Legionella gratiana]